ncbi:hypothetical protein KW803_02370 [Candidatus Saccharibacteria bacterium]|nr:hypothetical protein [Candidatus Saccharibacteria bacterium]
MKRFYAVFSAILILALAAFITFKIQAAAEKLPVRQYFPAKANVAVWDWTNPSSRSAEDLKQLDNFYYLHQIDIVYLDIGSYYEINKSGDKQKQQQLENSITQYIKAVRNHGVRVFAAGGDTDWSKPGLRQIPLAIQDYVYAYNARHPNARLSGMEFDIESYNQEGFPQSSDTEKSIVLNELLDTVSQIAQKHKAYTQDKKHKPLEIGFAVPYWFDNENGNIPVITRNGKTGPTLYHLVDNLNQLSAANITVMAYRNAASGNDGSIFHSRLEVQYAQSKASNVKVMIGQEVNDVEPAKITFFGTSMSELSAQARIINDEFKSYRSYGGIAINDLKGLQALDSAGSKDKLL